MNVPGPYDECANCGSWHYTHRMRSESQKTSCRHFVLCKNETDSDAKREGYTYNIRQAIIGSVIRDATRTLLSCGDFYVDKFSA